MLTFSRLGQVGRLGNQLFQVAFITSFAEKYGVSYALPQWKYSAYFDFQFNFRSDLDTLEYCQIVKEPALGYHEDYFVGLLPFIRHENVNIITGYFQSYKYFTKDFVRRIFAPKKNIVMQTANSVAISVRRGNFVTHKDYNDIEADTFRSVLEQFKNFKVFVFTDDYRYCRREFVGSKYEFFDGMNDIEQLQMMSKFQYFILSNSTFSYWGPMLSNDPKLVLYPKFMFPDLDRCKLYNDEYWPKNDHYKMYENPVNKMIPGNP